MAESEMKTLAIVGGGAAGLAAAVAAGERARAKGASLEIAIYERDDRVGRSILATGNGRCNFSNAKLDVSAYRNSAFVQDALRGLTASFDATEDERYGKIRRENGDDVHAFFCRHGLMWRVEDDGREYPLPNKASVVVDVLRAAAADAGAREVCGCAVAAVEPPRSEGGRFTLRMADGRLERVDAVILASGHAAQSIEAAGLKVLPSQPVLGPLRVGDADIPLARELDNIRVRCTVSLLRAGEDGARQVVASERGELMFRKYGVSGICVFNLSRFADAGDVLSIDLLDAGEPSDAEQFLFSRRKLLSGTFDCALTYADMLRGLVLPRVAEALLKRAGIAPSAAFGKPDVPKLAALLTQLELTVAGIGDESICQVHRGGLDVEGFDPHTMVSREVPGLFAAGEALDVDGPCGGYNLHWAWASGLLAGRSAAEQLMAT